MCLSSGSGLFVCPTCYYNSLIKLQRCFGGRSCTSTFSQTFSEGSPFYINIFDFISHFLLLIILLIQLL